MLQLYIGMKIYLVSSFPKKKLSIGFEKRQSCFATQKHKYYSNVAILTHSLSFSTAFSTSTAAYIKLDYVVHKQLFP